MEKKTPSTEKLVKDYKSRGWSDAKIQRVIKQIKDKSTMFSSFLSDLKNCDGVRAVIVHDYRGLFSDETVPLKQGRRYSLSDICLNAKSVDKLYVRLA